MQTRREVYAHRTRVFKAISIVFAPRRAQSGFWALCDLENAQFTYTARAPCFGGALFPPPAGPPFSMPPPTPHTLAKWGGGQSENSELWLKFPKQKKAAARPFLLGLAGCVTAPPRWPWGLNRAGCTKKRAGGAGQFPWLHLSYGSAPENQQQQPPRETAFSRLVRLLAPSLVVSSSPPPNPPSPPLPSSSSFSPSSPSLPLFLLNNLPFLQNTLSFPLSLS